MNIHQIRSHIQQSLDIIQKEDETSILNDPNISSWNLQDVIEEAVFELWDHSFIEVTADTFGVED